MRGRREFFNLGHEAQRQADRRRARAPCTRWEPGPQRRHSARHRRPGACARDDGGGEDRDADRYDASFAAHRRPRRRRRSARRRFARHGDPGSRVDAAGDACDDVRLPHALRRRGDARARSSSPTCRSAATRRAPEPAYAACAAALKARRADGQARRRRVARADRRVPRRPRHSRVRPRRPAAAVGQHARRLSRAGQDAGRRRARCSPTRRALAPPEHRLLVVECVPRDARRDAHARGRRADDRHRRRARLLGPGAGNLRHARRSARAARRASSATS